jgi:UPF0755 protein
MKRTLSIVFGVLFLFSVVAGSGAWLVFDMLTTPHSDVDSEKLFEIRPGDGLRAVTRRLETANLIPWAPALEGYARWRGYAGVLQAGRYLLSPAMTPVEMIATIVSGDAVFDELTITIPEGWSANDIELYLEAQGLFTKEQFQEAVVMGARYRDFPFLADLADDTILDGYLFPDTYRIFADSTPEGIVLRMLGLGAARVGQGCGDDCGGGSVLEPAADRDAPGVRRNGELRPGNQQASADLRRYGSPAPLQHLRERGPAPGADR